MRLFRCLGESPNGGGHAGAELGRPDIATVKSRTRMNIRLRDFFSCSRQQEGARAVMARDWKSPRQIGAPA